MARAGQAFVEFEIEKGGNGARGAEERGGGVGKRCINQ